ncbi:hypothetical protein RDWZM_000099 [Blomia tropicalis]|uniref:RING-type E3 ubiquitin transferase n=1 Tax=Blomia tropicalis TaxID=40697 RepID=A0A9Q0M9Y0_BLOTA|nr:hypothetical protein RDWZM_000099 [Blomia tropicalis]
MSKSLLCRYYSQGICNFGDQCIYSHDPDNSVPIPDEVCLFFLRSYCMNGENCTKLHKSIDELVNEADHTSYEEETQLETNTKDCAVECSEYENERSETKIIKPGRIVFKCELESTSNIDEKSSNQVSSDASKSYASVASTSQSIDNAAMASKELCTFFESNGFCVATKCVNVHGDYCDLCGFFSIHPFNETQREKHRRECVQEHEKNMEESFAYQRSKDLTCGICLDVIMDKESRKGRRFGILENCLHVYCIECIRTWRNSNFDKKNKRGCPQCRIKSDFIIPSEYFYDEKADKVKLINEYKDALSKQHCKYFKQGQSKCPFQGACFYKHEYPDGRKADLPMPSENRRLKGSNEQIEDYAVLLQSLFMDVDSLRQILTDGDLSLSDYEDIFLDD